MSIRSKVRAMLRGNDKIYALHHRVVMWPKRIRFRLKHVHQSAYFAGSSYFAPDLVAGPYVYIGPGSHVGPQVEIGAYTMFGPRVAIVGGDHDPNVPGMPMTFTPRTAPPKTVIGEDVWLGYGVVVIAGVTIGRGAVVGAGSIVFKDIPPYEIHVGVPARKVRDRFESSDDREMHDKMIDSGNYIAKFSNPDDMFGE
jgi:acetyltransferase-like isoleucine patch superfamily enzyme